MNQVKDALPCILAATQDPEAAPDADITTMPDPGSSGMETPVEAEEAGTEATGGEEEEEEEKGGRGWWPKWESGVMDTQEPEAAPDAEPGNSGIETPAEAETEEAGTEASGGEEERGGGGGKGMVAELGKGWDGQKGC